MVKFIPGETVGLTTQYRSDTHQFGLKLIKKDSDKSVIIPLPEHVIVGLVDELSTALHCLRTGEKPIGWVPVDE